MNDLTDRIALVTGGSRGIGRAIALALARAGAHVAVNYRTRATDAQDVCAHIARLGRRTVSVPADVSSAPEVARLVDTVQEQLGAAEEVAEVAVMLLRNGYVTGQTVNINGGWYMS